MSSCSPLVRGAEQQIEPVVVSDAAIMPRRDKVRPHLSRLCDERLKLDLAIAEHVGIGRPALGVFVQKLLEHAVVILVREIHAEIGYAQPVADAPHIIEVLIRGTIAALVRLMPIAHEQTDHVISLLFEERGGDRTVHASAHPHHYRLCHIRIITHSSQTGKKNRDLAPPKPRY